MKKLIWTIIVVVYFADTTFACDCVLKSLAQMQKLEIESSECIFVGEITAVNDDLTYEIVVIESLDGGDLQGNVYIGQNWKYCSPYVEEKGMWLVYGGMENGFLKMNICGISRAFDKPIAPPSISDDKTIDRNTKMTEEEFYTAFWKERRIDLADEIIALRRRRDRKFKKTSR